MAKPKPFLPAKLICGIIAAADTHFERAQIELSGLYGQVDLKSPFFPFDLTPYYETEMGPNLRRCFLSFEKLVDPERLSDIKLETHDLEAKIQQTFGTAFRPVNLDPGILRASSLIMATTKDYSHRVPLAHGIYAHLELLFTRNAVRLLDWTYPDFRNEGYQSFFREVRRIYLRQLKS
ncbi:MAG: DUF4416 family protein [Candidatus Aminicenantales bacterium]